MMCEACMGISFHPAKIILSNGDIVETYMAADPETFVPSIGVKTYTLFGSPDGVYRWYGLNLNLPVNYVSYLEEEAYIVADFIMENLK